MGKILSLLFNKRPSSNSSNRNQTRSEQQDINFADNFTNLATVSQNAK